MESLKAWVKALLDTIGDTHDKLNLKLSGFAMINSLGPHLLQRVNSLIGPRATGPEVFLAAAHQIKFLHSGENIVQ